MLTDSLDLDNYHKDFPLAEMTDEERGKMHLLGVYIVRRRRSGRGVFVVKGNSIPLKILRNDTGSKMMFDTVKEALSYVVDPRGYTWR